MRHLIMTPTSLSMSTPTLSSLHHQRMLSQSQSTLLSQSQSQSQSQSPSPLTPHTASPSFFSASSPKFPANYERSEKVSEKREKKNKTYLTPLCLLCHSSSFYLRFMHGLIAAALLRVCVCVWTLWQFAHYSWMIQVNSCMFMLCRMCSTFEWNMFLAFIHYVILFHRAALIHYFLQD